MTATFSGTSKTVSSGLTPQAVKNADAPIRAEDLINIGAYVEGSNKRIDYAIKMFEKSNAFLKQEIDKTVSFKESVRQLDELFR